MELTAERKVTVLTIQRKLLMAQVDAQNAQKRLESAAAEYNNVIAEVNSEFDPKKYQVNFETLEVIDLKPREE